MTQQQFIPTARDFEQDLQHDFPKHFPRYPTRFLEKQSSSVAAKVLPVKKSSRPNELLGDRIQPAFQPQVRRVRPVPIAPPPGFDDVSGDGLLRAVDQLTEFTERQLFKLRAISGILASEWSTGYRITYDD
jgi:hypothetical protein